MTSSIDLFGQVNMGYIVIESNHLEDWLRFGERALGLHVATRQPDHVAFRLDRHQRRIIVTKGLAEDVAAVGWQVTNQQALDEIFSRLKLKGVEIKPGSQQQAECRGVNQFWRITGPKGLTIELFLEPFTTRSPLTMMCKGFNTGKHGMGHVAITSREPKKMQAFWQDIFDARLSDYIVQPMSGMTLDITFLRLNPRHHSIAIAAIRGMAIDPIRTQIQHFNIEVKDREDLTAAYQRCKQLGYKMAHGIGQHPNDRELSFYVITPSGFEMEMGWDALPVDETNWQPVTHEGISIWGHHNEDVSPFNRVSELQQGLRSLLKPEYTPF